MNYILKAITDYPEAFEFTLGEDSSRDELLRIIFSAKELGTSVQQNSMIATKLYFGWTVLTKLGLRSIAMPMAVELLQTYNWSNHHIYAADICNQLRQHYYMYGNGIEAHHYEKMHIAFRDTYVVESKIESLFLKTIYSNEHGIELDKKLIRKSLEEMKKGLKVDSCKYYYYYYNCYCLISEGEEHKNWCLEGISYFKNLYFKHELYYNVFIKKLYTYYLSIEEYIKVIDELPNFINEEEVGSKSWYRLEYIYITALLNTAKIEEAKKQMNFCKRLKNFTKMSLAHIEEWEYLALVINSSNETVD